MNSARVWTMSLLLATGVWGTAPDAWADEEDAEAILAGDDAGDEAQETASADEEAEDDAGSGVAKSHGGWEDPGKDAWAEAKWDKHFLPPWVSVGIGFQGLVGANFIAEPGEQNVQGFDVDPDFPGFAGLTTGYGPSLDVRFLGVVGFELDIFFHNSSGSAELTTTDFGTQQTAKYDVEINHSAIHIPLLFKGVIPGEFVQPMLFLGPEFVMVSDPTITTERTSGNIPLSFALGALGRDYVMVTVGFGMEIMLPIPEVDIRIPLLIRGSFNPSTGSTREEVSEITLRPDGAGGQDIASESYYTEYGYQVGGQFGAAWHF